MNKHKASNIIKQTKLWESDIHGETATIKLSFSGMFKKNLVSWW